MALVTILVGAFAVLAPASASASSVGSPAISMTSAAAGATGVNYLVTFTTTNALAGNVGTITFVAPSGTAFASNSGLDVFDLTTATDLGSTFGPTLSNGGATATWTVNSNGVPARHRIRVTAFGVTNPAAGTGSLQLSTSADTTPVATPSYTLTAARGVSTPSVSMTSAAAGATNVTYRIIFTTSATGGLAPQQGMIKIAAPSGTVLASNVGLEVYDMTDRHALGSTFGPTLSNAGATGTWEISGAGIPAGKQIMLTETGVTNPAAASQTLTVSTSSDTVPSTSSAYTISTANAVTLGGGAISSPEAGATGVTYQVIFTTSATGGLAGNAGIITIAAGTGTVFPSGIGIDVFDLTTGHDLGSTFGPTLSNAGATATWEVNGNGVPAGQRIRLTITGVTNPAAGTYAERVNTSSDTVAATTPTFPIVAARSVSSPVLSMLTSAAGAAHDTYFLALTTSGVGEIAGGGNGSVTITAPAGTVFSPTEVITAYDDTNLTSLGSTFQPVLSNGGATATWGIKETAWPAGHRIELTIRDVTNPAAATGDQLTISTSSDSVAIKTTPYTITAPGAVFSPTVALTTTAASASGATYTVDFSASATGALADSAGTITVVTPTGTVIPSQGIDIVDLTTATDLGGTFGAVLSNGAATATWTVGGNGLVAGHRYQLTIAGVVNPAAGTGDRVTVSTSSDTVAANAPAYNITAPQSLSPGSVGLTNPLHSASSTYVVTVATSSTGGLADGAGTITVAAPAGTVIPNQGIDIFDLTTDTDLGGSFGPVLSNGGATATWTVGNGVPANTIIQLTITGVTNPAAGSYHLVVSSSSDSVAANTATYTIT